MSVGPGRIACPPLLGDDGATEDFPDFLEDIFRSESQFAMRRRALEQSLSSLLVEDTRVDRAIVQLTEREERRERDAAIAPAERRVRQEREEKRGDFVRKRRIRFASERRHLRALHGVDQTELRFDDAGMRLRSAEFGADRAMQVDEVLYRQITNAPVSR